MPRRLLGIFMLLLVSVTLVRAQGDVVLLTVGSEKVSRSEFEYHFSKSSEKRADVFLETFARFKQKVQCARGLGLDTLPEYCSRKDAFLEMALRQGDGAPRQTNLRQADRKWIKVLHVTWPLKQRDGKTEERRGKEFMDSLYREFRRKGTLPERMEELPWMQVRHLVDEWQCRLENLGPHEFSEPFYSPMGIHMVAWKDKFTGKWMYGGKDEKHYRTKEIEEGLLLIALDEYLQQTVGCSEQELKETFQTHGERYGRGTPHFKGAVIHARTKKTAKAVKKYLKKYPEALWQEAVRRMPDELKRECLVEAGLFPIGANPYVDKLAFKCGEYSPLSDYPYVDLIGKRLKKGPADYRDVREKLEKECLNGKKMAQMEAFMQKYAVEIDKEVLKTVNHADI